MKQAVDPHLTESYKLTQIVNKSISSLQMRKHLAEDTMNTLTEIIDLRSSCQMVWKTLNQLEAEKRPKVIDFSKLDNAVYFMSKCISLVEILGVHDTKKGEESDGYLKPKDIDVFMKIKNRLCEVLKDSMQIAIDQFNEELEKQNGSQGSDQIQSRDSPSNPQAQGEEQVKRIAHMFKLINMQEEGMKFYTNFIMLGKHNMVANHQASEQSTMKQIENVIVSMYQNLEEVKQKIMEEQQVNEVKSFQLLEEFSFSQYYAEF